MDDAFRDPAFGKDLDVLVEAIHGRTHKEGSDFLFQLVRKVREERSQLKIINCMCIESSRRSRDKEFCFLHTRTRRSRQVDKGQGGRVFCTPAPAGVAGQVVALGSPGVLQGVVPAPEHLPKPAHPHPRVSVVGSAHLTDAIVGPCCSFGVVSLRSSLTLRSNQILVQLYS